ncbi:hypothetical protein M501DRAFT_1030616 [Patellaria atrata CBS 101060]|uniref:Polycomb protein VEFS-Box domain-containing protein n=1 Tax=Patellaria atrata CBS 101060 TaxID=1346257 RepID=A0A9P4SEK9_9PEZI|nr:hypothetical protein M501DRAFT_1030616 [Patellaria atrata CBS 101060]
MALYDLQKYMKGTILSERFSGESRNPSFLRRNLNAALDYHKRLLQDQRNNKSSSLLSPIDQSDRDYEPRIPWSLAHDGLLNEVERALEPALYINISSFKLPHYNYETSFNDVAVKIHVIWARFELNIRVDNSNGDSHFFYRDVQEARLDVLQGGDDTLKVDVILEHPYHIASRMFTILDADQSTFKISERYKTQFNFCFKNQEDAKFMFNLLANESDQISDLPRSLYLSARWKNLPERVIPSDRIIRTCRADRGRRIMMKYGLKVDMRWEAFVKPTTALTEINRFFKKSRQSNSTSVGEVSKVSPKPSSDVPITYKFRDVYVTKAIVIKGYQCFICAAEHITQSPSITITFHLDESEARKIRPKDINYDLWWVSPRKPFDISKFLKGDKSWVVNMIGEEEKDPQNTRSQKLIIRMPSKPPEAVIDIPPPRRKRYPVPPNPSEDRCFFRTSTKRVLVEGEILEESDDDIDEEWIKLRRNVIVKDYPIPEYAKRFMIRWDNHFMAERVHADAYVSDSLVRFIRQNRNWLGELSIALACHKKICELKLDGLVSQKTFDWCTQQLKEAVTRHPDGPRLNPGKYGDFTILPAEDSDKDEDPDGLYEEHSPPKRRRGDKGTLVADGSTVRKEPRKMKVVGNGDLQGGLASVLENFKIVERESSPPIRNGETCVCGKSVDLRDFFKTMTCDNPDCLSPEFHVACVGLAKRVPGWKCRTCRLNVNANVSRFSHIGTFGYAIRTQHNSTGSVREDRNCVSLVWFSWLTIVQ